MKRFSARYTTTRLLFCAAFCLALISACQQSRDWQGVWADIAPAEVPQPEPAKPEAAPAPAPSLPGPAEISAEAAPYLLNLSSPDGKENLGRGLLLKPASALGLVYVGDYKGENASATIGGKSYAARLSGFDAATGFALAKIEGAFNLPALPAGAAEIMQGSELLIVATTAAAPVTVETRAAQTGRAAAADAPLYTAFAAARNLAGGMVFDRRGDFVGIAYIPQGSDLMALHQAEYLLGRCAALASLPPAPEVVVCPEPAPCPLIEDSQELADLAKAKPENTPSEKPADNQAPVWLGAGVIELNPAWAKKNGIAHEKGLYVKELRAGSPFEAAGIKTGDLLLELAGKPVETRQQLADAMLTLRPGAPTTVKTLSSDGRTLTLAVTPGEKK